MAASSSQGSAKAQNRVPVINLDDYKQLLDQTQDDGQPEGWYTAEQIRNALNVGENKGTRIIRESCKSGLMEFDNIRWIDWDGVNRPHRVYRMKPI